MLKQHTLVEDLAGFLNEKALHYESTFFIETDPISVPHKFSEKEDIEIAGFLSAIIAWGQRKTIIRNANQLMQWMDWAPYDFICNFEEGDLAPFETFKHRTFNGEDALHFINALRFIYLHKGGLELTFSQHEGAIAEKIHAFKRLFFEIPHPTRTTKHISDPMKGSSAKRINMFLRWMVRPSEAGVDFGIWNSFSPDQLLLPLDVHTGNVGRKLGLLNRKQNDWKAVTELTNNLIKLDSKDPVKYDFALFGLGAFEKF